MTNNKTAFITGASGGLGSCYANHLAKEGWNLIISGRNVERLEALKKDIEKIRECQDCSLASRFRQ